MTLRFLIDVIVWFLVWLAGWGLYGVMWRRKINYVRRFAITSLYFLTLSIVIAILFRGTFARVVTDFNFTPFVVLVLVYVATLVVYHLSRKYLEKPTRLISANPNEFFLTLDYRYLISKSFELLFQQAMIVLLILIVYGVTDTMINVMLVYGVIFALAHIPIYPLIGATARIFKLVYFAASIASAIVFPLLILKVGYGFVYSFVIHSSFYTLAALFFWGRNAVPDSKA